MKRITAILLMVFSFLSACSQNATPLTHEQIMSLEHVYAETDRFLYDTLSEYVTDINKRGVRFALVTGRVKTVSNYFVWRNESCTAIGYTIADICVDTICSEYSNLELQDGDVISVRQDYYVGFGDSENLMKYLSKETNIDVSNREDEKRVGSFETIMTPLSGINYRLYLDEEEVPMKEGETYTFLVYETEHSGCYRCSYIAPDSIEQLKKMVEQRKVIVSDDYFSIAQEIKDKFK